MGSKERIQRLKEETRMNILDASLQIAKEEGWQALSMRKIADVIEYSAPLIYEYFANKEALLLELTRKGYLILTKNLQEARALHPLPDTQLKAMWLAYWDFSMANKELYQLMFGVDMNCCCNSLNTLEESGGPYKEFSAVIIEVMHTENPCDDMVCLKYYTFWSVVHGLISINLLRRGRSKEMNQQVLEDTIGAIIKSIEKS